MLKSIASLIINFLEKYILQKKPWEIEVYLTENDEGEFCVKGFYRLIKPPSETKNLVFYVNRDEFYSYSLPIYNGIGGFEVPVSDLSISSLDSLGLEITNIDGSKNDNSPLVFIEHCGGFGASGGLSA